MMGPRQPVVITIELLSLLRLLLTLIEPCVVSCIIPSHEKLLKALVLNYVHKTCQIFTFMKEPENNQTDLYPEQPVEAAQGEERSF